MPAAAPAATSVVPWAAFCELRCEVEQLRVALAAEREQRQRIERALLRLAPGCLDRSPSSPAGASAGAPLSELQDRPVHSRAGTGEARGAAAPTDAGASSSGGAPALLGAFGVGGLMHELAQAHDSYLRELSSEAAAGIAGGAHPPTRRPAPPRAADPAAGSGSSDAADDDDYWSHSGWGRDTLAL